MKKIVAVATTSFGKFDKKPLQFLSDSGFEILLNPYGRRLTQEELTELAREAIGVIAGTEAWNADVLGDFQNLEVISRCGVGMDNIDLESAKKRGIRVYNTPNEPTVAVAELVLGLIFALLRNIPLMDREIRKGVWKKRMGALLYGKQVGIIGFGKIGRKVAELLKPMGANVFYTDPVVAEKEDSTFPRVEFKELLRTSDIVSLHLSYSKENYKLLGQEEFSLMKNGAFLINCSRGGIVDENALYLVLKEGKLAGAAIDVFEQEPYNGPLKELDNIILTTHIGSYAKEARVEMEMQAVKNLLNGLNV